MGTLTSSSVVVVAGAVRCCSFLARKGTLGSANEIAYIWSEAIGSSDWLRLWAALRMGTAHSHQAFGVYPYTTKKNTHEVQRWSCIWKVSKAIQKMLMLKLCWERNYRRKSVMFNFVLITVWKWGISFMPCIVHCALRSYIKCFELMVTSMQFPLQSK